MNKILAILLVATSYSFSQEVDIVPALQQIENGNIKSAETILRDLKTKNANDPSVIFLDAVLTKNGEEALKKYSTVLEKYPDSKYTDAVIYRIFSYYYSLGYYRKAETYLDRLKKDFPESPYIKTADRKIPDIEELPSQSVVTPSKPIQTEKIESKIYNFTIQAGAFLNVENAKKLSEQLKRENYITEITTKDIGGSILNVVNVGRYTTEDESKTVLVLLEKKFNLKGRIVPINK
jgi:tetratricopeptide (TPR) repeat protein